MPASAGSCPRAVDTERATGLERAVSTDFGLVQAFLQGAPPPQLAFCATGEAGTPNSRDAATKLPGSVEGR